MNRIARFSLLALLALAAITPAAAQNYPNRAVQMIIPFPPGGNRM